MNFKAIIASFCASFITYSTLNASSLKFKVVEVGGEVKSRSPFSADWKLLAIGAEVEKGSIINIPSNSMLSYDIFRDGKREQRIVLNGASTFRIDIEAQKKIKVQKIFIDLVNLPSSTGREVQTKGVVNSLKDAWNRVQVVTGGGGDAGKINAGEFTNFVSSEAQKKFGKSIELANPKGFISLDYSGEPFKFPLRWDRNSKAKISGEVKLYFWKDGESQKHVATVDGDYYNLKISNPGKYRSKVVWNAHHNGRNIEISSDESIINVRDKRASPKGDANEKLASGINTQGNNAMSGKFFPKNRTSFKMPSAKSIDLSWRSDKCSCDEYELEISIDGKTRRIKTRNGFYSLPLDKYGEYSWSVSFIKNGEVFGKSRYHSFNVLDSAVGLANLKSGSIYLLDGFN